LAQGRGREDGPSSFQDKPGLPARIAAARILAAVLEKKTSLDGMLDSENGNPFIVRCRPRTERW